MGANAKAAAGWFLVLLSVFVAMTTLGFVAAMNTIGAEITGTPTPMFGSFLWTVVPYVASLTWAWWSLNRLRPKTISNLFGLLLLAATAAYVDVFLFLMVLPPLAASVWLWRSGRGLMKHS